MVKDKTIKINSVGRTEKHKYDFRDHSGRLQVIFDALPMEFISVKLQQTVFSNRIRQIYRYSLHCTKSALDTGLVPLMKRRLSYSLSQMYVFVLFVS